MEGFFILLILFVIGCIICGPVALIISIIALNKLKAIYERLKAEEVPAGEIKLEEAEELPLRKKVPERPVEVTKKEPEAVKKKEAVIAGKKAIFGFEEKAGIEGARLLLEQRIGTRWVLVAGVITVFFGVGFFLKYAYDTNLIGPLGRVVIAAVGGLIALGIGEWTRKRGYGIVARGVTALGFAILYAAVFSAYRFYGLVNVGPAFVLAILVTVAAMLYAVSLDEVVIALLSLLGGFLTPVIVSTGENLPMPLFSYVSVLGIGAMLCAYYRKWRAVNILAFAGTFALYIGWFEEFYRPAMKVTEGPPEQMGIALGWLGAFFAIYLVLPILYGLVRKVKARGQDVLLVLGNAAITFFYLWTILFDKYRTGLAFCSIVLCAAHLIMLAAVIRRYKDDVSLRFSLLVIGLFFLTIAVPLYLKMYAVAMAWAVEGVVLAIIGLRYRSIWTQVAAAVAFWLSLVWLLYQLPMHTGAFRLVFNPAFGTWCFVGGMVLICHIIYRGKTELPKELRGAITQILYAATMLLLMAAAAMEWYWHCDYNLNDRPDDYFIKGMVMIFTVFTLLFVIRPICPRGIGCRILSAILAGTGAGFTMISFAEFHRDAFMIFANADFWAALVFVAGLFLGAWLFRRAVEEEYTAIFSRMFALMGIFVLWVLLTEEIYFYWYCRNRFVETIANWRFLGHMYISVMWAVYGAVLMAVGFWRKSKLLRYIALGLFALLLAKVFILDTSRVKNVYRIAAFLATGVTLVGVSYLYQFLRKKGFFEAMLAEKSSDK